MTETRVPRSRMCYCTNVHSGRTPGEILQQLDANDPRPHRELDDPDYRIGLWLSQNVARVLDADDEALARFASELAERNIRVLTLNGFPQRDFHQPVVKREVYRPNWADPERLEYTLSLARVLTGLIPENQNASISTVPVGWPADLDEASTGLAVELLTLAARELRWLSERTGRTITLDLEPEPGCVLDTAPDVTALWERLRTRAQPIELAHLGVCHDVCHSAVMFEDQRQALRLYHDAGVRVHKVQVSSAVACEINPRTLDALSEFDEPRYLHQTTLRTPDGTEFFEDLGEALASESITQAIEARVHFHVPMYADSLGPLSTTQPEIAAAVHAAQEFHPGATLELETYAWPVLPAHLQPGSLAAGIAAELDWFEAKLGDSAP